MATILSPIVLVYQNLFGDGIRRRTVRIAKNGPTSFEVAGATVSDRAACPVDQGAGAWRKKAGRGRSRWPFPPAKKISDYGPTGDV